ncbi:MAG: polysaccharide pyruvyl transferase family protein, partial [Candidatus Methylomirabilales bacterium]
MRQPLRARIGVWGTFDLDSLGDQLRLSVLSHELARRLPGATIRAFAPYGYLRPTRLDGGEPAEPLGAWSEDRAAELAAELDCVIVAGVELHGLQGGESLASRYGVDPEEIRRLAPDRFFIEGLGPELEGRCPIVWSSVGLAVAHDPELASRLAAALSSRPHISVRDEISRARLEATGVTRTIEVVPDPALLAPRLYPASLLEKRLEYLRLMEWYPRRGGALVLQASKNLASQTTHLTAALRPLLEGRDDLSLVIARVDPGDEALSGASHFALPAAAG